MDGGRSKDCIRQRLETLGIKDLDAIAMTHPDANHITGLLEVLALYDTERVCRNGGESHTKTFASLKDAITQEWLEVTTVDWRDTIPRET